MKRSRLAQEQIIGALKEHQALATAPFCAASARHQRRDISTWRLKYGSMDVSDIRKLKGFEEDHAKLKTLLAEQVLNVATLKKMLAKNSDVRLAAFSRDLGD